MNKPVRITESQLHSIIRESVNNILSEMDWKTYINAANKRKQQADKLRKKDFGRRNSYDDKADELEKHAQDMFRQKHGKNGKPYNYEGDSPDFLGRTHHTISDWDFQTKNPNYRTWTDTDSETTGTTAEHRKYRFGQGTPYRKYGTIHDDTFDFMHGHDWSNDIHRHDTRIYNKDGEQYNPYLSSVGNEISVSQDPDYLKRQQDMTDDMNDFYTGKSKYTPEKGWDK